jgi:hypothetical protein
VWAAGGIPRASTVAHRRVISGVGSFRSSAGRQHETFWSNPVYPPPSRCYRRAVPGILSGETTGIDVRVRNRNTKVNPALDKKRGAPRRTGTPRVLTQASGTKLSHRIVHR